MPCGPNSRAIDCTSRRSPPLVALKAANLGRPRSEPEAPVKITVPRPSGARRRIASRPNRKPAKQPTRQESSKCCAVISRKSTAALLPMLKTNRSAGALSASSAIALSNRRITSSSLVPSTVTAVAEPPSLRIAVDDLASIFCGVRPATSTW